MPALSTFIESCKGIGILASHLVFPPTCLLCNVPVESSHTICADCVRQMHMLSEPLCHQCSHPFEYAMIGQDRCEICLHHPPAYDAARAVWRYDDISAVLVKKLKFADKLHLAEYLGRIMRYQADALVEQATLIAPVPLFRTRLRQRRYNQSMLLARSIAAHSTVELIGDLLMRTRNTTPQTSLDFSAREGNVKDAFAVRPPYLTRITGERVLLVDDVMTTGATLHACATTLKAHGAAWVGVVTIAKRLLEEEKLP